MRCTTVAIVLLFVLIPLGLAHANGSPPVLSWLGTPGYDGVDGCNPDRGEPNDTLFKFKVLLTDADGDEPTYVRLILHRHGALWKKVLMRRGGGWSTVTGRRYFRNLKLPLGNWEYRMVARDDDGPSAPTPWCRGPVLDSMPYLTPAGGAGYWVDGIDPNAGFPDHTVFRFKIKYVDIDGDMPAYVKVYIRNQTRGWSRTKLLRTYTSSPDPKKGIVYRWTTTLPAGQYIHRFLTRDDDGWAAWPRSGGPYASGPMVGGMVGSGGVVTGLSAVAVGTGAQISFSLSSDASVQARVLNIAGRPVKTICTARECEAGANTLLWNAQSDQGLVVPNGTYLVEVTARAEGGGEARALARVRITR